MLAIPRCAAAPLSTPRRRSTHLDWITVVITYTLVRVLVVGMNSSCPAPRSTLGPLLYEYSCCAVSSTAPTVQESSQARVVPSARRESVQTKCKTALKCCNAVGDDKSESIPRASSRPALSIPNPPEVPAQPYCCWGRFRLLPSFFLPECTSSHALAVPAPSSVVCPESVVSGFRILISRLILGHIDTLTHRHLDTSILTPPSRSRSHVVRIDEHYARGRTE